MGDIHPGRHAPAPRQVISQQQTKTYVCIRPGADHIVEAGVLLNPGIERLPAGRKAEGPFEIQRQAIAEWQQLRPLEDIDCKRITDIRPVEESIVCESDTLRHMRIVTSELRVRAEPERIPQMRGIGYAHRPAERIFSPEEGRGLEDIARPGIQADAVDKPYGIAPDTAVGGRQFRLSRHQRHTYAAYRRKRTPLPKTLRHHLPVPRGTQSPDSA